MTSNIHRAGFPSPSYSTRSSREHLLPKSQRPRSLRANHVRSTRALQLQLATTKNGVVSVEQKRSHGIGGAGNIRRPSEVVYPLKLKADGTQRRGMAWSAKSIAPSLNRDGKRPAILSLFSKKGSTSERTAPARVIEQRAGNESTLR